MKAIVAEIDHTGLHRLLGPDAVPASVLVRIPRSRAATLVWALLDETDAADVQADVRAGRHEEACGLLLNRAVELLALGSVVPSTRPIAR